MNFDFSYGASTTNNGNVTQVTDQQETKNYSYQYDSLNRITQASGTGHLSGQDFSYDPWGNMIKLGGVSDIGMTAHYNNRNRRIGDGVLTYDLAGNVIDDQVHSYVFDGENRITSMDSGAAVYEYDVDSRRFRRTANGTTTYYIYGLNGEVLSEFIQDNTLPTSQITAPISDSQAFTRYHHQDHLGTPRVITDQSGGVVSRHNYYPFGDEIPPITQDGETHKFTGKERDSESALDNFLARYHSSAAGRFCSVDPGNADPSNPQSWNRFVYTLNNPLKYVDPDGKELRIPNNAWTSEFSRLKREYAEAKGVAKVLAWINLLLASDPGLTPAFATSKAAIIALDTSRLIELERIGARALEGVSGRLVISKTAFYEFAAGSGVDKANALLSKYGIEKFFGIKNIPVFEEALEKGLKLGLTRKDARILATAKAQGTAISSTDKELIKAAIEMGVAIVERIR